MKYILRPKISIFNSFGLIILLSILIFTFPRYFQVWKGILILILLLLGFLNKLRIGKVKIDFFVFYWFVGYLCFALIWNLIGFFNKNPGVSDSFRLEFGWTLIIFILVCSIHINSRVIYLSLYIASLTCSLTGLYYIFMPTFGELSFFSWMPFEPISNINGLIRTTIPNISFMSFLLPTLIFLKLPENKWNKSIAYMVIAIALLFISLAGRRIIQIVVVFTLLSYLIRNVRKINVNAIFVGLMMLIVVIFLFRYFNEKYSIIDFKIYYNLYIEKLFTHYRDDTRYQQLIEFWKHTKDHPLFGVGFGKGIPTIVRDVDQPWRYELTYSLYLYQTGFIGFTFLLGLWFTLYYRLRKYSNLGKALSIGLISYLIASATNPYFTSGFDYKYPLLLIMLFITSEFKDRIVSHNNE